MDELIALCQELQHREEDHAVDGNLNIVFDAQCLRCRMDNEIAELTQCEIRFSTIEAPVLI